MLSALKSYIPVKLGYMLRRIKLYIRGLMYRGDNFFCPVCNTGYRSFLEGGFNLPVIKELQIVGAGRRKNAVCPGCSATDRDRLVYLALQHKKTALLPAAKILHIAPEPSLVQFLSRNQKKRNAEYIQGVKYHEGFYYSKDIQLIDLLELTFDNNTFDLIICNHVLEHIEDDRKAMRELCRVLKPGKHAIVQVPWSPVLNVTFEDANIKSAPDREKYFGQFDHVRVYASDYKNRLVEAGFEVRLVTQDDLDLSNYMVVNYGLNPAEILFLVTKPRSL